MTTTIESLLITWVNEHGKSEVPIDAQTRLFEDGILDSILLPDLLLYLESLLSEPLSPSDLTPDAFQSIATIAEHFAGGSSRCVA